MKIEKIKKNKNKYELVFDNNNKILTYEEILIKYNLLYKKDIDEELLNKIKKENDYYNLYNKCINLISKKVRCKKEINNFLNKNTNDINTINKIINKLIEKKLLNDKYYAKCFLQDKLYLSNYGPYKIKQLLLKQEIDEEYIDEIINNIDQEYLNEKINKLIVKKIKSNKSSSYFIKQKIITDLYNLGYSKELIIKLLDNYKIDSNINEEFNKIYNRLSSKYKDDELKQKIKNKLYVKGYQISEINEVLKKMD